MKQEIKEQDLYDPVKEWLEKYGYEVFAEVNPKNITQRADVVGKHGKAIVVVELKTSLTLELLDQAYRWKNHAHYVYIAIPKRKKDIPFFVRQFLQKERIGLITVDFLQGEGYANSLIPAQFNRPLLPDYIKWEEELLPQHQTWVKGGSSKGGHVTPYKLTIEKVKDYLHKERFKWYSREHGDEGWRSIQDILEYCETHYRQPKTSLTSALLQFEHEWCEKKKEDGKLWFRHKEESAICTKKPND